MYWLAPWPTFLEKILDAKTHGVGQKQLGALLEHPGALDRKLRAQDKGKDRADDQNHQGHHQIFGNRVRGIVWLYAQSVKELKRQGTQNMVEPMRKMFQFMFHSLFRGAKDAVHTNHQSGRSQGTQT